MSVKVAAKVNNWGLPSDVVNEDGNIKVEPSGIHRGQLWLTISPDEDGRGSAAARLTYDEAIKLANYIIHVTYGLKES